MGENAYQTKAEVQVLITEGLKDYERHVVEPRHKETQGDLAEVKKSQSRILGWVVVACLALAADLIVNLTKH